MDLKQLEDIYDNQITIKPGVTKPVTQQENKGYMVQSICI